MRIAQQYYLNNTYTPIDKNSPCQNSYILVIGDGDWSNHNAAENKVRSLYNNHKIKTFAVAFGTGISSSGLRNFNNIARAGGTTKAIEAKTAEKLKTELKAAISQIIASKLSFTAPAITATLTSGGSLYQAQFDYQQNKEWSGTISRTKINPDGSLDKSDAIVNKIKKILDEKIRPAVARDGGDIIFKSFEDGVVKVQLKGSCSGCPSSIMTLKQGVQNLLRHYIPVVKEVISV